MHVRPVLRALVTAGVVAGLVLPGTAYAETFKHADPAKDVQSVDVHGNVTNQPRNKTADVTHVTINHTTTKLKTTVKLRALAKSWIVVAELKTRDKTYDVFGTRSSSGTSFALEKPDGTPLTCDGLTGRQDRTKHTISFTVPSSCVGTPGWVKAGVGVAVGVLDLLRRRRVAQGRGEREPPHPERQDPPGLTRRAVHRALPALRTPVTGSRREGLHLGGHGGRGGDLRLGAVHRRR